MITRLLGEQKGGSVVTENPKEGSLKTLEGFRGRRWGGHLNLLEKGRHGGGGGSRKSSKVIRGDHFSVVTFKGGIG